MKKEVNTKVKKGFVISDLHLCTSRTNGLVEAQIEDLARYSDFCILNGDIFDFKWSTNSTIEEGVDGAISWIIKLCEKHPDCRFYYILGNHDCLLDFVLKLDSIQCDNFSYHRTHLFLNDILFLHGDLPLNDDNPFYRLLVEEQKKKGGFLNLLYDTVINLRIHKVVHGMITPNYCVKKIISAIRKHNPEVLNDIKHVYFGHTHTPFSNFLYKGIYFHNTGSAIKHLKTNPLEVSYEAL